MTFKKGESGNPRGHWVKGQSGNPGGRPKEHDDFRKMCRSHSPEALARLVAALDEGGNVSVAAAKVLLEYAWGKAPMAPTDAEVLSSPLAGLTLAEIRGALSGLREDDEPS